MYSDGSVQLRFYFVVSSGGQLMAGGRLGTKILHPPAKQYYSTGTGFNIYLYLLGTKMAYIKPPESGQIANILCIAAETNPFASFLLFY